MSTSGKYQEKGSWDIIRKHTWEMDQQFDLDFQ